MIRIRPNFSALNPNDMGVILIITAIYLRKSRSEENEPVSDTLARHREILTSYAKKERLNIVRIYEEVASGDSLYARPQMLKLLEDLSSYEAVLCMDIDRLGRGAMHEQGLIFDAIRSAEVLIVTPSKTYDMTNDTDDSLISFKALFAREEYKMIRSRLKRGTIKAVEEGCYLSNAPFGYKQVRVNKKPTLEIVPEESEGVLLIFKWYCEGQGCQSIADKLHALGYKPRRGQKFHRTTIAKIIRNPVYIGKVVWNQFRFERPKAPNQKHKKRVKPQNEWIVVDGFHNPIVSREIYEEANRKLRERYHVPYNDGTIKNSFAGILFCKSCGKTMVRRMNNKKYNQPMILCETTGCMMGSSFDEVEKLIYVALQRELAELKTLPDDVQITKTPNAGSMLRSAQIELSKLEEQLDNLSDFLEQGVYDVETFISRRDKINERIKVAKGIIEECDEEVSRTDVQKKLETVLSQYWEGSPGERNQLLKSVIKRITYEKPKGSGWGSAPNLYIEKWRS